MKRSATIFIITLFVMAALDAACQTIAKGNIISDDPFYCYMQKYNDDDSLIWVRFDYWEYIGSYRVKIDPFDTLETLFVNARTYDTTAVTFTATEIKHRFVKNVYLSGNKQVIK